MSVVNALLRVLFEALLWPLRGLPAAWGLVAVSALTAVGLLVVFKKTSNQRALAEVKRKIHACLFEIRLFNDDFRAIFRAQIEILRHNLTYLRHSMAPMLWTLPPLVLAIAQLNGYYGYEGLAVGRAALVKVTVSAAAAASGARPDLRLESGSPGLRVVEPAVWIPVLGELAWRVVPERAGDYELRVVGGTASLTKTVHAGPGVVRRSPIRPAGLLDQVLYPAEPPLPDGPVQAVTLAYPEARMEALGWEFPWLVGYFLLSILFAFLLRGVFKVTI
jgi:uncharacterized membrane protein (DUF106 family)